MSLDILSIVGARPQFVKAAVLSRAFRQSGRINETILHTGQHFDKDMSDIFFRQLAIPTPRYNLNVNGGLHGEMTAEMLTRIEAVLKDNRFHLIVVYGDTNSTLAGALAAAKLHIPIVHVESGLRSFNRSMPEEINRVLTDHLSTLLFCPTNASVKNLGNEGIIEGVYLVGDVMYDATRFALRQRSAESILGAFGLIAGQYNIATLHRAETTSSAANLQRALNYIADTADGVRTILPLHPRTKAAIERWGLKLGKLELMAPVGYVEMAALLSQALMVFTDSGGLQKEAYFHRVPCVTLRSETEWIETIEHGWNRLWSTPEYKDRSEILEYGNGEAGREISERIVDFFS